MRLEGQSTIAACERQLRRIHELSRSEPLQLPTRARYSTVGGEASLAQLIITWAQRQTTPHLQTYFTSDDDPQIDDFVRRFYGLTASLCATTASGSTENINVYDNLRAAALSRLDQLQNQNAARATRGPAIDILCADHLGKGEPYLLYRPTPSRDHVLRSRADYRALAAWMIRRTLREKGAQLQDLSADEALGALLYEVFRNTEDHALVDRNGDELGLSIRAVRAAYQSLDSRDVDKIASDFEPLGEFCRLKNPAEGASHIHFFEVSILDSGPGFAQSWTGRRLSDLSDEEEMAAVSECFSEGSSKRHDRFGEGLPLVVELLTRKRGFLRLRTGRVSLYAQFNNLSNSQKLIELNRWQPSDGLPLSPVAGTLMTMLIPLEASA